MREKVTTRRIVLFLILANFLNGCLFPGFSGSSSSSMFQNSCWQLYQSNGYTAVLKLYESGNSLTGTLDWTDLGDGHHFPAVVAGIDSVTRIYFQQHGRADSTTIGYYYADVKPDSLLNGITRSNQGAEAEWHADRINCPQ